MNPFQLSSQRQNSDRSGSSRRDGTTRLGSVPFGIIDIGSNSVRLVIYESARRNPVPIFNEKIMAGLGGRLGETGKLDPEGKVRAINALIRFAALLSQLNVKHVDVVATAAVRDATDGDAFRLTIEETTGLRVRLLSGDEEARLAGLGVLSGIPAADGIVGDLGGGSLELINIRDGKMTDQVSLPLGPLRLLGSGKSTKDILTHIDEALACVDWLGDGKKRSLYAVGGVWRNLARIHMAQNDYKIRVLQNYTLPSVEAAELSELIEHLGPKTLAKIPDVSSRRVGALPMGAHVLSRLIGLTGVKDVVISAYGVREGLLFDSISDVEKARDPLLAGAQDLAERLVRFPAHADELIDWTATLFAADALGETAEQARIRMAACILADIGWYAHPDYRSAYAFEQILAAPLSGLTHAERLHLARIGYHRHEGASEPEALGNLKHLLEEEGHERARTMGLALRLGFALSAASIGVLPRTSLRMNGDVLRLTVNSKYKAFIGEVVEKRLAALAKAMNLTPETLID